MIEKIRVEQEFKKYVKQYDIENPKIKLKIKHTFCTANLSEKIAKTIKLNEEDVLLAWLIGILHDIGRFEQIRIYNTFNDLNSIDHANYGVKLLFDDMLIENFTNEKKYYDIICKAIKNHNKMKIEDGLNEKELVHAKIIRDADKTDILRLQLENLKDKTEILYNEDLIKKQKISPKVLEDFLSNKLINRADVKNEIDKFMVNISFIYDYNYRESLDIVRDNCYIEDIIKFIDGCEQTREQTNLIRKTVLNFLK